MHRRLQFGMRENPASNGRHGSRLVACSHPRYEVEKDTEPTGALSPHEPAIPVWDSSHAVKETTIRKSGVRAERLAGELRGAHLSNTDPQVPNFEPLLDTEQAATLLKIHPKTLQKLARRGTIGGIQIGKLWRFRVSALNRWLEGMRT